MALGKSGSAANIKKWVSRGGSGKNQQAPNGGGANNGALEDKTLRSVTWVHPAAALQTGHVAYAVRVSALSIGERTDRMTHTHT